MNTGEGSSRGRSSDKHDAVIPEHRLREIERRLAYVDGNGVDPGGGALGARRREIKELRMYMETECREIRTAITAEVTPLKRFDEKMKVLLWLAAITLAGAWGPSVVKLVKLITETVAH